MSTKNKKAARKPIERKWHLIDASSENLGRLTSKVASLLRGKGKVSFTPHIDGGDFVVFINTDKLKFSRGKDEKKIYYHYSGYPGGMKAITLRDQIVKDSRKVIKMAVYRMLPKNKTRDVVIKRLKLFKDDVHPFADKFKK
ncbi:MAG: 50S ribosomal protein L13 [Candidatus Paceibacterota bacterium]|jgi:large subunit ribosomal protein L13